MKMLISNSSQEPIYEQITTQIRDQIIKGTLEEGFLLPSISNLYCRSASIGKMA